MKMKQTGIRIEDDLKAQAIKRAKDEDRTLGGYIRMLIKRDLAEAARKLEESGRADLEKATELQEKLKKKLRG